MKRAALRSSHLYLYVLGGVLLTTGCASLRRNCVPEGLLNPETTIDLSAENQVHYNAERKLLHSALEHLKSARAEPIRTTDKQYHVLALSGGGSHGAYSAGVINGWTASGQRPPELDIVSGVSTGALISTFAFLGAEYDDEMRDLYTSITSQDVYRMRFKPAILWKESAASSEPLKKLIDQRFTAQMLLEVAQAHAKGRRLYVGSTNLDTGRLAIWDMGAIASSGKSDSLCLFRQILLASASVPGFFPPVSIEVTVNGQKYTELHADGGTTAQVFFRATMLNLDPEQFAGGKRPLTGSTIHIIVAGKVYPDPQCVKPRTIDIAKTSLGALTFAQTRNDLIRIYTLSLLTGMEFSVTNIPQDLPINEDMLQFNKGEMQQLFDYGYQAAQDGRAWSSVPPVVDASQQSVPRAGVEFMTSGQEPVVLE